ncbi:MAG: Gfo/Idh/MocA family oxidoreductase [Armatimonadetes bacterium]|nr:Gfo/Idh/MocA family oxidoreductase [Armatimonadota bacterium]
MRVADSNPSRRGFLKSALAAGVAPLFVPASALGKDERPAPSNRIVMGAIGMGGRGTGDMGDFLGRREVQMVAVCDVVRANVLNAKGIVDRRYANQACAAVNDFREITSRDDIDAVMIGTPDHWHATISCDAMRHGKDVFCEKPETLTVHEGQVMIETARRLGRVFSGGSQRVWEDYNFLHRIQRSGVMGALQEVYVNVGGPSVDHCLPAEPVPDGLDWDMWLGPAPKVPFNHRLLDFRAWRDYSGGGMTDWGAHGFGGALFLSGLHETGPTEIIPADGRDTKRLTYRFANGMTFYHGGGWGGILTAKFEGGEFTEDQRTQRTRAPKLPANLDIPNYKGNGGLIGDFLHCVQTREKPFRDIAVAHRTVTVCHLGNIATWLGRPLRWDPEKEEILGDPEASRWLSRPRRGPWAI